MTAKKSSTTATWTDPDDAPALSASFFKKAEVYEGPRLKARGRPKAAVTKEPVKLRLDADVLRPCALLCDALFVFEPR